MEVFYALWYQCEEERDYTLVGRYRWAYIIGNSYLFRVTQIYFITAEKAGDLPGSIRESSPATSRSLSELRVCRVGSDPARHWCRGVSEE